jgi:tetratricopeptide (TPR) repeat protein
MQRPTPGQILSDRFTLDHELGRGGSGTVWLAEDRQLGQRVALKILAAEVTDSPAAAALLREECRKASQLTHPNIVRVYEFHEADIGSFVSMQYIEGSTLGRRMPMSFPDVVECALSLCDAIEHAHRSGIVHRDIKPANVLVDSIGNYYLTDFGIASGVSASAPAIRIRGGGSLPSMSPQQLNGDPAAVTDDIYGLGALIHELLSGVPLFYPEPTPQRIRNERPPSLSADQTGREIPRELSSLVFAMLDKDPARRPAGIGAVRSVLEDIRDDFPSVPIDSESGENDETVIRPRRRSGRDGRADGLTADGTVIPPRRMPGQKRGLPTFAVLSAFAVLIVIVIGVVFLLPKIVAQRGTLIAEPQSSPPSEPVGQENKIDDERAINPAVLAAQRARADEMLGELLAAEERLLSIGIERWGGEDWREAGLRAEAGHVAYRKRDYDSAMSNHRQALDRMRLLEARAPEVFSRALQEGNEALRTHDQEMAVRLFEIALSIRPLQPEAQLGLQRALGLDRVLEFMDKGAEAERSEDWSSAESLYRQALELDAEWPAAIEALARVREAMNRFGFETQMAAGFSAVQRQDYEQARRAFRSALKIAPDNAVALEALRQVDADLELKKIVALRLAARNAEADERWADAVRAYNEILAVDPGIEAVKVDLKHAQDRVLLANDLDSALDDTDRFYEDKVAQQATVVLMRARSVTGPGPQLAGQIEQLETLLRIAATPVQVDFESDNLTDVVIYKVGRLGIFSARTIELKPGVYVAVGTRDGYRDVRRSFRVVADGAMPPITLACEEPI